MSSLPISSGANPVIYDFTNSPEKAMGGIDVQNQLSPIAWGMIASDGNKDGEVDNRDKNEKLVIQNGGAGHLLSDYTMNGVVDNADWQLWDSNCGKGNKFNFTPFTYQCGYSFTDERNGKSYRTLQIGQQCWMAENLNYATALSMCYDDNEENCNIYGRLYRSQSANVCPGGWHLPSSGEFSALTNFLGGVSIAGGKMKTTGTFESGTGLWNAPNTGATNASGFSALPAGVHIMSPMPPNYQYLHQYTHFWSSTTNEWGDRYSISLSHSSSQVTSFYTYEPDSWSVRCIKD